MRLPTIIVSSFVLVAFGMTMGSWLEWHLIKTALLEQNLQVCPTKVQTEPVTVTRRANGEPG